VLVVKYDGWWGKGMDINKRFNKGGINLIG
jgi:hypothetical protein